MQWDNFGWSLRGQTWTNLCWSLCLRYVEVCCTFLSYYWTCENIWSSHTFCCLTKCRPNYLREFSHMLQSAMLLWPLASSCCNFSRLLNNLSEWSMTLMMWVELHRVSK
ncbi:hypothetical protein CY35_04G056300 [Sphagnum magellanicum]|nr:hypothetical protein CY35_04G056300 [Sphagnum magellanicum]